MKILRKHCASGALTAALAAVTLIAAQVAIVGHDLADDSHALDSVCEFCIAGTSLAGANVGAAETVVPARVSVRLPHSVYRVRAEDLLRNHFARAAPTAA